MSASAEGSPTAAPPSGTLRRVRGGRTQHHGDRHTRAQLQKVFQDNNNVRDGREPAQRGEEFARTEDAFVKVCVALALVVSAKDEHHAAVHACIHARSV